MKLAEIIAKIDKSPELSQQVYISEIAEHEFNLDIQFWGDQTRLVYYYIAAWHCTDSKVGYRAYFFDGKFVALSYQSGRKSSEDFRWTDQLDYQTVREYVKTFDTDNDDFMPDIVDLDEELGEYFKINYYEQMYDFHKKNATYKGEAVEIVDVQNSHHDEFGYVPEHCSIKYPNGLAHINVPTIDLDFKYNLTKKNLDISK